jgi:hypothetical protein
MTGLVRKATLLSLCGVFAAGSVMAGTPSGTFSTFPPNNCVKLVGKNLSGTADAAGVFTIIVRDGGGNLVPNSNVVLDFSSCPDVHMASQADLLGLAGNPNSGLTENTTFRTVTRAAGPSNAQGTGQVSFTLQGGAIPGPGSGFLCAKVIADNVQIGTLTIVMYDSNGSKTIDASDLSVALSDTFSPGSGPTAKARTDFNCDGTINASDLSVLLGVTFGAFTHGPASFGW